MSKLLVAGSATIAVAFALRELLRRADLPIDSTPVTIAHASAVVAVRACTNTDLTPWTLLNLDVDAICRGEAWRLVTALVSTAPSESPYNTLVHLAEMFTFGARLQAERFNGSAADYAWFLLTTGLVQAGGAAALIMGGAGADSCLVEAPIAGVVHLWSQTTSERDVQLGGALLSVRARHLTAVGVVVRVLLLQGSAQTMILGATAAHAFHLLSRDARCEPWLRAPEWLRRALGEEAEGRGSGGAVGGGRGSGGAAVGGGRRVWGTGRRLGRR